jgi:hypothetical protein
MGLKKHLKCKIIRKANMKKDIKKDSKCADICTNDDSRTTS